MRKVALYVGSVGNWDEWEWEMAEGSHRIIHLEKSPMVLYQYSPGPGSGKQPREMPGTS